MVYQEKMLTCTECNASFAFTTEEQAFHAERGYTNEPKRCPSCRQSRRSRFSYGGGGDGGGGGGGSYDRPQREMHKITCGQCGKEDEVPFLPRGDRPVYCRDCFSSRRESSYGGGRGY